MSAGYYSFGPVKGILSGQPQVATFLSFPRSFRKKGTWLSDLIEQDKLELIKSLNLPIKEIMSYINIPDIYNSNPIRTFKYLASQVKNMDLKIKKRLFRKSLNWPSCSRYLISISLYPLSEADKLKLLDKAIEFDDLELFNFALSFKVNPYDALLVAVGYGNQRFVKRLLTDEINLNGKKGRECLKRAINMFEDEHDEDFDRSGTLEILAARITDSKLIEASAFQMLKYQHLDKYFVLNYLLYKGYKQGLEKEAHPTEKDLSHPDNARLQKFLKESNNNFFDLEFLKRLYLYGYNIKDNGAQGLKSALIAGNLPFAMYLISYGVDTKYIDSPFGWAKRAEPFMQLPQDQRIKKAKDYARVQELGGYLLRLVKRI